MNRADARRATFATAAPRTAIISITDTGGEKNDFFPQSWLAAVLEMQFLDVEEGAGCITRQQARDIAGFAKRYYGEAERFIVHCEFGQSRSAAVAAAICKYFEGHDGGIFRNPAYFPNPTCYRYVWNALEHKPTLWEKLRSFAEFSR